MMSPNLLVVEMRRALHRRVVRVLVLLALIACVFAGVVSYVGSSGKDILELHRGGELHPAVMRDWWVAEKSDGAIIISAFFLVLGGLFGGAAVAGGEWRAATVATTLTWEPRRVRLHIARTAACAILAFLIAFGLQVVFLAAFVPSVLANGTTSGTDTDFWISLGLAVVRIAAITGLAAVLGVSLATLGRSTAFALMVAFAWMAVVENLLRALTRWEPYLWAENLGTVMQWAQLEDVGFDRGPAAALVSISGYVAVLGVAAAISFARRDVATAS